jgi:NAD(P)-dependent dehydrogenase (short-subunit alcohol dehydrogenase family)
MTFTGKTVVVTGGSKGIGKSLALGFYHAGANVVICSRNKSDVQLVCGEIDKEGKRFLGITADVAVSSDSKKVMEFAVEKFGAIDILVNNAGVIGEVGPFHTNDISKWSDSLSVNLLGSVNCSYFVIPFMKESGAGKIINFAGAGVGSKNPLPNLSSYYTSKVAVAGFTETLAAELSQDNIQVNCIAPGAITTNITDYFLAQGEERLGKDMYERTRRQKEEGGDSIDKVLDLVLFLASDSSKNITGRLLSAKWDLPESLLEMRGSNDLYKLRRIDNQLFYGK